MHGDNIVFRRPGETRERTYSVWNLPKFITCDPAASAKTSADWTVSGVWAQTPENELALLDADRFQLEVPDIVPRLESLWRKWRQPGGVWIEAVAANNAVFAIASRTTMPARRLDPLGQDKLVRATPAMNYAATGRIWLPPPGLRPGIPLDEIESELYRFTGDEAKDDHDDCVDMVSYAAKVMAGGPSFEARHQKPMVYGDIREKRRCGVRGIPGPPLRRKLGDKTRTKRGHCDLANQHKATLERQKQPSQSTTTTVSGLVSAMRFGGSAGRCYRRVEGAKDWSAVSAGRLLTAFCGTDQGQYLGCFWTGTSAALHDSYVPVARKTPAGRTAARERLSPYPPDSARPRFEGRSAPTLAKITGDDARSPGLPAWISWFASVFDRVNVRKDSQPVRFCRNDRRTPSTNQVVSCGAAR